MTVGALLAGFGFLIIGAAIAIAILVAIALWMDFQGIKNKYFKMLWGYKLKVLEDEMETRGTNFKEIEAYLEKPEKREHILDEIEKDVKGDVKDASQKTTKKGGN